MKMTSVFPNASGFMNFLTFQAKVEEDNGGNSQTKSTTAQKQGCQSADIFTFYHAMLNPSSE